jgi:hypothetical protein
MLRQCYHNDAFGTVGTRQSGSEFVQTSILWNSNIVLILFVFVSLPLIPLYIGVERYSSPLLIT